MLKEVLQAEEKWYQEENGFSGRNENAGNGKHLGRNKLATAALISCKLLSLTSSASSPQPMTHTAPGFFSCMKSARELLTRPQWRPTLEMRSSTQSPSPPSYPSYPYLWKQHAHSLTAQGHLVFQATPDCTRLCCASLHAALGPRRMSWNTLLRRVSDAKAPSPPLFHSVLTRAVWGKDGGSGDPPCTDETPRLRKAEWFLESCSARVRQDISTCSSDSHPSPLSTWPHWHITYGARLRATHSLFEP